MGFFLNQLPLVNEDLTITWVLLDDLVIMNVPYCAVLQILYRKRGPWAALLLPEQTKVHE